jgi:hypothetical protein
MVEVYGRSGTKVKSAENGQFALPWWGCRTTVKTCIEKSTPFLCLLGSSHLVWYSSSPNTSFSANYIAAVSTAVLFEPVVDPLLRCTAVLFEPVVDPLLRWHPLNFSFTVTCMIMLTSYMTSKHCRDSKKWDSRFSKSPPTCGLAGA